MPQPSRAYAVGRVRAQSRKPLGNAQLERLVSAPGYAEARAVLSEMGWAAGPGDDVSRLSVRMMEDACARIRAITPDPTLTDTFLLRHDAQNLKALLKARLLGTSPEGLSACGTIPAETLRHAVAEHEYRVLPQPLRDAVEGLEKQLAMRPDPRLIEVRVDQGLFALLRLRAEKAGSLPALRYFTERADLLNAIALLRLMALGRPFADFTDSLLPGGSVERSAWAALEGAAERLPALFKHMGGKVHDAMAAAVQDARAIPLLEKAMDDRLLSHFRPYRFQPDAPEVLVGDLLARERETAAVRLILTGKLNGFPVPVIRERLREAYGG